MEHVQKVVTSKYSHPTCTSAHTNSALGLEGQLSLMALGKYSSGFCPDFEAQKGRTFRVEIFVY